MGSNNSAVLSLDDFGQTKNEGLPQRLWVHPTGIRVAYDPDADATPSMSLGSLVGYNVFVTRRDSAVFAGVVARVAHGRPGAPMASAPVIGFRTWDHVSGTEGSDVWDVPMSDIDTIFVP